MRRIDIRSMVTVAIFFLVLLVCLVCLLAPTQIRLSKPAGQISFQPYDIEIRSILGGGRWIVTPTSPGETTIGISGFNFCALVEYPNYTIGLFAAIVLSVCGVMVSWPRFTMALARAAITIKRNRQGNHGH